MWWGQGRTPKTSNHRNGALKLDTSHQVPIRGSDLPDSRKQPPQKLDPLFPSPPPLVARFWSTVDRAHKPGESWGVCGSMCSRQCPSLAWRRHGMEAAWHGGGIGMEAAADEWFAAMRAWIRFGMAMAAIAAIKEKPFPSAQTPRLCFTWLVVQPQNYGKSSAKDLCFSHDRNPAVTRSAIRLVHRNPQNPRSAESDRDCRTVS